MVIEKLNIYNDLCGMTHFHIEDHISGAITMQEYATPLFSR